MLKSLIIYSAKKGTFHRIMAIFVQKSINFHNLAGYTSLVDAYVTPCVNKTKYNCASATQQAADAINNLLRTSGANIGRVWLQVLDSGEWPNTPTANQQFIQDFANQVIVSRRFFCLNVLKLEGWEKLDALGPKTPVWYSNGGAELVRSIRLF